MTPAYAEGGRNWIEGKDLYNGTGHGFIYLPISAVLYAPLALGDGPAVEIAWRILTVGSFAGALWFCSRLISSSTSLPCFAVMSGIGCILAFPAARNGQATLPMAALLVAAIRAAIGNRYRFAAVTATLAILLKPLALPVIAILAVIRPRLIPLVGLGCLSLFLLPFLLAETAWVHRQNAGFIEVLQLSQQMQGAEAWATFFGVFDVFGVPVPAAVRLMIQVVAAIAVLVGCRAALTTLAPGKATLHIYALTFTLLLLFSPRTENNTYACIAPAIVLVMACTANTASSFWAAAVAGWLATIAIIGSYEIGRILAPETRAVWLAPLTTSLLTPWLVWRLVLDLQANETLNLAEEQHRSILSFNRLDLQKKAA